MRTSLLALGLAIVASPALANGDAVAGEELFMICSGCHQIGPDALHGVGPHLNGILGRQIGSVEGFHYSPALRDRTADWTPEALDAFLSDTTAFAYGTYMIMQPIDDASERADLIAYLATLEATPTAGGLSPEVEAILALPADDAYGNYLSSECTSCHSDGAEGIPAIAGLPPASFIAGLADYRSGDRDHQVMNMIAARLGDEEIAALAAYFETAQ